ncbi:MAG: CRTAC1 family protein [Pirellulales bacterium]
MLGKLRISSAGFPALGLLIVTCTACQPDTDPPQRVGSGMSVARAGRSTSSSTLDSPTTLLQFASAAESWGVSFEYTSGEESGLAALPEVLGGGVALSDFDLDGRLDVFFPGGGRFGRDGEFWSASSALFLQPAPLRFQSVGTAAGVATGRGLRQGAFVADLDEDGFPDLIVTGWRAFTALRNQGDGTFVDVTDATGLADDGWTTGVAWGDLNGDGGLDLYVARFVDWDWSRHRTVEVRNEGLGPDQADYADVVEFTPQPDRLWLASGDGRWRDATATLEAKQDRAGLSAIAADADQDGDLDLYVTQFGAANLYYRNEGNGRWTETAAAAGIVGSRDGNPDRSTGVDFGDLDRDGYPDLWVVNGEREVPAFYRNVGRDLFHHSTYLRGLNVSGVPYSGWGTSLADLDRDEDLDIVIASGSRWRFPPRSFRQQTCMVFENQDGERFASVGSGTDRDRNVVEFLERVHAARGLAVGDLDDDGDLDLAYSLLGEPAALLENRSLNASRFLRLRLIGARGTRTPVGAKVEVVTKTHDQLYFVTGGGGYLSTNDSTMLIGLGRNDKIDLLRVTWPGGGVQERRDVPAGERLTWVESPDETAAPP